MTRAVSAKSEPSAEPKSGRARSLENLRPWQPGQPSANPSGRAPVPAHLRLAALEAAPDALNVAIGIVRSALASQRDSKVKLTHSESHVRWAVDTTLERALGRAEQSVHVTGDTASPERALLAMLLDEVRAQRAPELPRDVTVDATTPAPALPETGVK